jgi:hypothetical protein
VDGLMTFCHDARKGRNIGSHWPNHVRASAPLDLSMTLVVVLLFLGIWYFRRMEKIFADVI